MKIVFWGTPEYSVKSLEAIINSKHKLVGVVTQPDKKRSRGNRLIPSPVKESLFTLIIPITLLLVEFKSSFQSANFKKNLKLLHCVMKNLIHKRL